jgi:hypothetical protein
LWLFRLFHGTEEMRTIFGSDRRGASVDSVIRIIICVAILCGLGFCLSQLEWNKPTNRALGTALICGVVVTLIVNVGWHFLPYL